VRVLASAFDEVSTSRFLTKLERVKPIAKSKKSVLLVANRQRHRQRAAQRLLDYFADSGLTPVASLTDRALYLELDGEGRRLFDIKPCRR
jgi:chromosome partitioning protein